MAEFREVAKHWKRMCNRYWRSTTCSGCPIAENEKAYEACSGYDIDVDKMEELVMSWATEHPEPVYPTFAEWLNSIGVTISDRPFPAPNIPVYVLQVNAKMFEPIPADIAQKLGVRPKEG